MHFLESLLLFYFHLSFPVFFFSFHLLHCELFSELDNLIAMESLCYSANKESDDAYDVSTSLTHEDQDEDEDYDEDEKNRRKQNNEDKDEDENRRRRENNEDKAKDIDEREDAGEQEDADEGP